MEVIQIKVNLPVIKYVYCIAVKFGEFGKSFLVCKTKTIQIFTYNYNLLAESIHSPNFICQMIKISKFAKLFCYMVYTFGLNYIHVEFAGNEAV